MEFKGPSNTKALKKWAKNISQRSYLLERHRNYSALAGSDEQGRTELKCPLMHKKWFKKHPWHIIKSSGDTKPMASFKTERMNSLRNLTSKILPHMPDSREPSKVGNLQAKDSEQACSSETSNSEILEVNELVTSSGDTLTESIITPCGSLDLSVGEEFGGPSLLIDDVLIPLSIENKNSVSEIVSPPQFELCLKIFKALTMFRFKPTPSGIQNEKQRDRRPDLPLEEYIWWNFTSEGIKLLFLHKSKHLIFSPKILGVSLLYAKQSCLGRADAPLRYGPNYEFAFHLGKIEAGDSKIIRISFQSTTEGVFSETWELYIEPLFLHSASPITFHFSGVFFRNDEEGKNQPNITEQIQEQITCKMAKEIVVDVVNSIAWNKPKIRLNNDAMTATENFEKYNPGLNFSLESVQVLETIQKELTDYKLKDVHTEYSFRSMRKAKLHSAGLMKHSMANNLLQRLYEVFKRVSRLQISYLPNPEKMRFILW
ncbi:hypothetical protein ACTXT7_002808 [Hymenolepis weldensis]